MILHQKMKIVIITPVRNEGEHIRITINCMLNQTLLPIKWIIVNDGSKDDTEKIVKEFSKTNSFMHYISLPDRGKREPGRGVVEAFYKGYSKIAGMNYDILAKFDADLEFPPNTLEKVCQAFLTDPNLGITGGTRYEKRKNENNPRKVLVPKGFVGGPFKFYRKKCFEDINGLTKRAGWDGVDTIKANMKGWRTGEIESLKIFHLKPTGTAKGEGLVRAWEKYGDVSYYMGGYLWYFFLRVAARTFEGRNPKVGYYMLRGYLRSIRNNVPRESRGFRRFLKRKQLENMIYWFRLGLKGSSQRERRK